MESEKTGWGSHTRTGLGIGALGSMMSALLICGAIGSANEYGWIAISPDDLCLGFAEHSMMGMVSFGVPICGILGGLAGAICGWIGGANRSPILGAITPLAVVPLLLVAECILFRNPFGVLLSQGPLAWAASSLVGAVIAGVYCSFSDLQISSTCRAVLPIGKDADTPAHPS